MKKRIIALLISFCLLITLVPAHLISAADVNTVSLKLYNSSETTTSETPVTDSYVWEKDENTEDVFRLVVDMNFGKQYMAGDIKLTIKGFETAGRDKIISRKGFGNESGVFKEISDASVDSGIVAQNTAAINGSAAVSVSYQFKPEQIKDYGILNKTLSLYCTLEADGEVITSNIISFTTDFVQSWSIVNSGDHDEAYDEIEVYQVNEYAPVLHTDRLVTIDGTKVEANSVSDSNYYWVEYRVPLLTDDPLGLYKHYIDVYIPNGCIFYSAQVEYEDSQVTPPKNLNYEIVSDKNSVLVDCADYINEPHSADNTDSYYYFVVGLDKSLYNNTNVVKFKEAHVHKDSLAIKGYSENTETIDEPLDADWGSYEISFNKQTRYNSGIAKKDFLSGYERDTKAVPFNLPVTKNMKVSSQIPFGVKTIGSTRTQLNTSEYDISSVNIPAHYLNDNGEIVYGIQYSLYTSENGTTYNLYKEGSVSEDITVDLPENTNYAYVLYSPSDKTATKYFYTYGSGDYAYGVSPSFTYKFTVSNETYNKLVNEDIVCFGISAISNDSDGTGVQGSVINYIVTEDLVREYRLRTSKTATVKLSGNHYDITPLYGIDFRSNTSQEKFSSFKLVSVIPSNYYGSSANSADILLEKVLNTLSLTEYNSDETETQSLTLYKTNSDGTIEKLSVTSENIKNYVNIQTTKKTNGSLSITFDFDFGEYSILNKNGNATFFVSYTWPMSRMEEESLGVQKTFDMISALHIEGATTAETSSSFPSSSYYAPASDNGSYAGTVSSVSVTSESLSDTDRDNNTTEFAYFAKTNILVLDTGETAQLTSIEVETRYTPFTASTYANPAITGAGQDYTLAFSFAGYSSEYRELIFVSNLGNSETDASNWKGIFQSVESVTANFTDELTVRTYYQPNMVDVDSEMSVIKNNGLSGSWLVLNESVNPEDVKALAVKVYTDTSSPIQKEDTVRVHVKMKSPSDAVYNDLYNRVNFGCVSTTADNSVKGSSVSDYVVIKQMAPKITFIKRIKAKDVNLANGVPTFIVDCKNEEYGHSFILSFDEYETIEINGELYYQKTYDIIAQLDFGSYILTEKDCLRYGKPYIEVVDNEGIVSENTVSLETSFENPEITIISVSEKLIHGNLSHNALCVNEFDNKVE